MNIGASIKIWQLRKGQTWNVFNLGKCGRRKSGIG